jgi:hypothetical protein
MMDGMISGGKSLVEGTNVEFFVDSSGEPGNFHEAFNHPKFYARVEWCLSICKESENMKNKGVWGVIPKDKTPKRRRCEMIK